MNEALRHDIEVIGRNNPIVNQALMMANHGQCSYEEALQIAVLKLAAVNECHQKTLIEYASRQPASILIMPAL